MSRVVIGVDPHKASNTLVVIDERERVLAQQRFANDRAGYRSMKTFARGHRDRIWAVEGARGVGAGLAQRLVAEGEPVLDVPARLSARVRALGGGSGRKTDDADAFAVAVAGLRARDLQAVRPDDATEILRMLSDAPSGGRRAADRHREPAARRALPADSWWRETASERDQGPAAAVGGAAPRRGREGPQAARPGLPRRARAPRRPSSRSSRSSLAEVLAEHPTTLREIDGVGPINAAKILAEVGDVRRFPSRHHFASYTGTAPIDVSSGDNNRHRLNRGGNRRLNHALHIAAVVQYRMPGPGQDYYRRKRDQGKTHLEALRCLKRRLSDVVYRHLVDDLAAGSPGGQVGASLQSSAADLIPMASTSEQSLPGLAHDPTPVLAVVS